MKIILSLLIAGMLTVGFFGSAYASYSGMGLAGNQTFSMRDGSIGGIGILGGGPGSGK